MRNGRAALILAVTLLIALIAGPPARADEAPRRDELVIGITQFPSNWHPSIEAMEAKAYVLGMTRRPFTAFDTNWRLVCMLCTELPSVDKGTVVYETRPDGKKGVAVTYTIQPKATWGDGVPVTTKDVLFTWEAGKYPKNGYGNFDLFSRDIIGIDVKDDHTFTIHRDKPVCEPAEINDFELLPEHIERKIFEQDPVTYRNRSAFETDTTNPGLYFGPYRITKVEPGSYVVLEPNPTWWGAKPAFKRIVIKAVENTAALEANLLAGQVDMVPGEIGLPLDQVLAFEKRHAGQYQITYKPGLFFEHLDVNLDNPILADARVRQALLYALDREAISKQLYGGRQPVADNQISPLDRVHEPGYPVYRHDPAMAAKLLDEAGWTGRIDQQGGGIRTNARGEKLSLEVMTTAGNRSRELLEQVLQSQWRQVGIDVRIVNQPARVLFGDTLEKRHLKGMALFAWVSAPENIPRTIFHSSMIPSEANNWAGQNYAGYKNPEMDKTLDDLEHVCAPDANKALWAKLQTLYAKDLPNLPLFFRADPFVLPNWLVGVVPTGQLSPSSLWVETWKPKG